MRVLWECMTIAYDRGMREPIPSAQGDELAFALPLFPVIPDGCPRQRVGDPGPRAQRNPYPNHIADNRLA